MAKFLRLPFSNGGEIRISVDQICYYQGNMPADNKTGKPIQMTTFYLTSGRAIEAIISVGEVDAMLEILSPTN